jgi:hypothetical protein
MELIVFLIAVKEPHGHIVGGIDSLYFFSQQCGVLALQSSERSLRNGELKTNVAQTSERIQHGSAVTDVLSNDVKAVGFGLV